MKRFNFLLVVIAIVLTVTAVSCTTVAGTEDGYYDGYPTRVYGNRVYVDDPYRGTIVLERDARTGRYYEVGGIYDGYYGNRYYDRGRYGYGYHGRSSGVYYRNNNNNQSNQRPVQEDRGSRQEARDKVLGKH